MNYKNIEIHNVAELFDNGDGSVSWRRVPSTVLNHMEAKLAPLVVHGSTGVELRFVIRSGDEAVVRMSTVADNPLSFSTFHVFRGSIQGGNEDHEIHRHVTGEVQNFVIKRSKNIEKLRAVTDRLGYGFDPEVVRIVFDRGAYRIYDVLGDVTPPTREQTPKKTLLAYGSSITHGSNSIDRSHSWVSVVAHNLNMDARNLGFAGSCAMEPEMADYIAAEGERGAWDVAVLELGINVLKWEEEKFRIRSESLLREIAERNPDKPILVVSPFYHCGDDFNENDKARLWRSILEETVLRLRYPNVTYLNGFDVLDGPAYISADEVHPNIYGVQRIADVLTECLRTMIAES